VPAGGAFFGPDAARRPGERRTQTANPEECKKAQCKDVINGSGASSLPVNPRPLPAAPLAGHSAHTHPAPGWALGTDEAGGGPEGQVCWSGTLPPGGYQLSPNGRRSISKLQAVRGWCATSQTDRAMSSGCRKNSSGLLAIRARVRGRSMTPSITT